MGDIEDQTSQSRRGEDGSDTRGAQTHAGGKQEKNRNNTIKSEVVEYHGSSHDSDQLQELFVFSVGIVILGSILLVLLFFVTVVSSKEEWRWLLPKPQGTNQMVCGNSCAGTEMTVLSSQVRHTTSIHYGCTQQVS